MTTDRTAARCLVLAYVEQHPGQRPRDICRALQPQYPTLTYDTVVSALRKLARADELCTTHPAPGVTLYWPPVPPPPLPWVNPIRARFLQLTGVTR
jgi:Fe2+ or Zn2+ uptake regulation protein